jgi:hypothetical protein
MYAIYHSVYATISEMYVHSMISVYVYCCFSLFNDFYGDDGFNFHGPLYRYLTTMKCISLINAVFIWVVICLILWAFVPSSVTFVHDNAWWILGLTLSAWWLYGYIGACKTSSGFQRY